MMEIAIMKESYKKLRPLLLKWRKEKLLKQKFSTFHYYKHFGALIRAYAFSEELGSNLVELVPLADMLNHANEPTALLEREFDRMSVKSQCTIHSGSQLWNSYGKLGNEDLLHRYGFILDGFNPHDTITISLEQFFKDLNNGKLPSESNTGVLNKLGIAVEDAEISLTEWDSAGIPDVLQILAQVVVSSSTTLVDEKDLLSKAISEQLKRYSYTIDTIGNEVKKSSKNIKREALQIVEFEMKLWNRMLQNL
eukprot:g5943.t1